MGFLHQNAEKFNVVELTETGRSVLRARGKITLTRPMKAPESSQHRAGEIACDEELFEKLRQLRKRLADERAVPSYIVFSDVALRQMARTYPANAAEFSRISGVGDKKLREFGAVFLGEIAAHLQNHPRQIFADDSFAAPAPPRRSLLTDTVRETLHFFRQHHSVAAIAQIRGVTEGTIYGHLADALAAGEEIDLRRLLTEKEEAEILSALARYGTGPSVSPVVEALGGRYPHGLIRICRAAAWKKRN
jgi:ATP-dependent DNA helicase RecQ